MTQPAPWAIVTGAARGIGAAVSIRLAADGFDLVLVDGPALDLEISVGYPLGTAEQLDRVAERCAAKGGRVLVAPGDVRDESALATAVELVPVGGLQVAVAVAGVIGGDKPAWEFSHQELATDLAVNFHGVANLARATIPRLLTAGAGPGRFVAVVSTAGEAGLPRLAGYVSSKHAALGFIRSLAADLGPLGVTANAVLPGSTRTALLERSAQVYGLRSAEDFAPHQRLGRLVEPAEIAAAVGWLCGPDATAVTGAAIRVDGGFVG
jgi:SDR family mycofactocin-dependent oxidoreductase